MGVTETINHPSVQRELDRFRNIGGSVQIREETIVLGREIVPGAIAEAFAGRLRALDKQKTLKVVVKDKA